MDLGRIEPTSSCFIANLVTHSIPFDYNAATCRVIITKAQKYITLNAYLNEPIIIAKSWY